MKWRHQGAWRGGEGGWKQRRGEARSRRRGREWGGIRRIALRLCSIKGEITHLLRFFLKTTALIDQTAWMYRPIFNMKYRHQKSITPVFPLPSPRACVRACVRLGVAGSSSQRRRLMHLHQRLPSPALCLPAASPVPSCGYGSPAVSVWHAHYVICRDMCLTNGEVDHIQ